MDTLPTAQRQTFDVDAAPTEANAYSIGLDGGAAKTAVFTITLKQKQYNPSEPTTFSLTMLTYNTCIPIGDDLAYNYHDSLVSSDETMTFECKGPFRFARLCLLVDGIWKDGKTVEGYTLTIECSTPAQIAPVPHSDDVNSHKYRAKKGMMSDAVVSRCLAWQPTRQATFEPYAEVPHAYKITDYGNPKLSLYGCIIVVARGGRQVIESLDFDNLNDFVICGEDAGTTTLGYTLHGSKRILLKRTRISEETFSYKSQWKTGKEIRIPGGAGDWGDHRQNYPTAEQWTQVAPRVKKTKEKLAVPGATKGAKPARKGTSPAPRSASRGSKGSSRGKGSVSPARRKFGA